MKVLALDTSTPRGSVALLEGEQVVAHAALLPARRSMQTLAPTVQRLLEQTGWEPEQLELVAVSTGPGSFTGLRLGVTTAKVLAWTVGAEVLGVNTLEAIAWGVPQQGTLHVGLDAQRGEVFAATFTRSEVQQPWQQQGEMKLLKRSQWLQQLGPGDWVAGPVLQLCRQELPQGVCLCPEEQWYPWAAQVGQLAKWRFRQGQRQDVWSLLPQYYRPSPGQKG